MGRNPTPHEDLSGRHFNDWTVQEYVGSGKWLCRCMCGAERRIATYALTALTKRCRTCYYQQKRKSGLTAEAAARRKTAVAMRAEGKTYAEIAKALGVSRERARQLVRPLT